MTLITKEEAFTIEPEKEYTFYIYRSMSTPHQVIKVLGKELDKQQLDLLYGEWLITHGHRK